MKEGGLELGGRIEIKQETYSALSNWSAMFAYVGCVYIVNVLLVVAWSASRRGPSTKATPTRLPTSERLLFHELRRIHFYDCALYHCSHIKLRMAFCLLLAENRFSVCP